MGGALKAIEAGFYQREVDYKLANLSDLIQPILTHLAVCLVLNHQIRNFNLSIRIPKGKLRCQTIRHRGNGNVPFWHIRRGRIIRRIV